MEAFDIVITGGEIVDGRNRKPFRADVGIAAGEIVAVRENIATNGARQVIDAAGKVVAPGFIDVHTHYDAQVFWDPTCDLSSHHGYTTVLMGNCGFSLAPLARGSQDYLSHVLAKVEAIPLDSIRTAVPFDWSSFGEMLARLDGNVAINVGVGVGHTALRAAAMGERAVGHEATAAEMEVMKDLLHSALREGAIAFTSSQSPTHKDDQGRLVASCFASDEEVLELASIVRDYEGVKLGHVSRGIINAHADPADAEWLAKLSAAAGRPLDYPVLYDVALSDAEVERLLSAADVARRRGGEVVPQVLGQVRGTYLQLRTGAFFDAFPSPWPELYLLSHKERVASLQDPATVSELERAARERVAMGGGMKSFAEFEKLELISASRAESQRFVGRTLGDIGHELGCTPLAAWLAIGLPEDLGPVCRVVPPTEADERVGWARRLRILRDNRGILSGTDAGAHNDMMDAYAQSSRLISRAVRDFGLMPIEEAVHKLTKEMADYIGLVDRGVLAEGWRADVIVFDLERLGVAPVAPRDDLPGNGSRLYAENRGMEHVIVNGVSVLDNGAWTGATPGKVLRSGRDTYSVKTPRFEIAAA